MKYSKKKEQYRKKSKIRLSFLTFQSLYIVDKRLFFFETESRGTLDGDIKLIRKMQKADIEAFDLFVCKYYEDILRYCFYHGNHNEDDAKDLTQNTFLQFFKNFSRYKHMGKAKNYLYTIARNLCIDFRRNVERRRTEDFEEYMIDKTLYKDNTAEYVHECLQTLPEEYKEVLILYYFQDMKQHEIAKFLGIGLPLVKYRMKKAKEKMKIKLKEVGHYGL